MYNREMNLIKTLFLAIFLSIGIIQANDGFIHQKKFAKFKLPDKHQYKIKEINTDNFIGKIITNKKHNQVSCISAVVKNPSIQKVFKEHGANSSKLINLINDKRPEFKRVLSNSRKRFLELFAHNFISQKKSKGEIDGYQTFYDEGIATFRSRKNKNSPVPAKTYYAEFVALPGSHIFLCYGHKLFLDELMLTFDLIKSTYKVGEDKTLNNTINSDINSANDFIKAFQSSFPANKMFKFNRMSPKDNMVRVFYQQISGTLQDFNNFKKDLNNYICKNHLITLRNNINFQVLVMNYNSSNGSSFIEINLNSCSIN